MSDQQRLKASEKASRAEISDAGSDFNSGLGSGPSPSSKLRLGWLVRLFNRSVLMLACLLYANIAFFSLNTDSLSVRAAQLPPLEPATAQAEAQSAQAETVPEKKPAAKIKTKKTAVRKSEKKPEKKSEKKSAKTAEKKPEKKSTKTAEKKSAKKSDQKQATKKSQKAAPKAQAKSATQAKSKKTTTAASKKNKSKEKHQNETSAHAHSSMPPGLQPVHDPTYDPSRQLDSMFYSYRDGSYSHTRIKIYDAPKKRPPNRSAASAPSRSKIDFTPTAPPPTKTPKEAAPAASTQEPAAPVAQNEVPQNVVATESASSAK